jgi:3-methyladenine DNA glycosylase AlkD
VEPWSDQEVFDYVVMNKARMPRTSLRYTIELIPKELKAEAMKRVGKPEIQEWIDRM